MSTPGTCKDLIGGSIFAKGRTIMNRFGDLTPRDLNVSRNVTVRDSICFDKVVGPDGCPGIQLKFKVDEPVPQYRIVRMSPDNDFCVRQINLEDDIYTGVLGVSTTEGAESDDIIKVCTTGVFKIEMEHGNSVDRGDFIRRSTRESGKGRPTSASNGVFAIALESLTLPSVLRWSELGGDDDFDTQVVSFDPVSDVSALCFSGSGTGHTHEPPAAIMTIDLWDGSQWVNVYTQSLPEDDFFLNSINVSFPPIASVSQLRIASDPEQDNTFHDMRDVVIHFTCPVPSTVIKACFHRNEAYD
jgi:hypothetical protein